MTAPAQGARSLPYIALPASGAGAPVLIIHSWWGLTRPFRAYADRLSESGFLAGCADLYEGRVATSEGEARELRRARRRVPMYRNLLRGIDSLRALPEATSDRVALVGFSMGGHWAVWLTVQPHTPVSATVLYYGVRGGDFSRGASPVMAHFAGADRFVSARARRTMEKAIARSERRYSAYDYPGTRHWFAESDQPSHDPEAAELALARTIGFLADLPPAPS